jgi:hypothetical protein
MVPRPQKSGSELDLAGREAPYKSTEHAIPDRQVKERTLTVIFASENYVAVGDMCGSVSIWNLTDMHNVTCKRFSIGTLETTKITGITQLRVKDKDALLVLGSSGSCLLLSLDELFSV